MNHLSIYADPLGDLYVEWKLTTDKAVKLNLPHYKYEMSKLLGIPVPFSSMAEKLDCEVFRVVEDSEVEQKLEYHIQKNFNGSNNLVIYTRGNNIRKIVIQYVIRGLVTRDKVFFNFVFSLASPLDEQITTDVELTARFSYDINSYKLKAALISKSTGRIVGAADLLQHKRQGDFIKAHGRNVLLGEDDFDLHVHASRLPFMVDRRIFWIVVFTITAIGLGTLLSLFKLK